MQVAARPQCAHLVQKTLRQHRVETPGDALVQHVPVGRQQRQLEYAPRKARRRPAALQLGKRPAGQLDHFQRALQALRIVAADPAGGGGVEIRQPRMHGRPTELLRFGGQSRAGRRVGFRQVGQPLLQRAEVQPGTADQQRHPALRADPPHRRQRVGAEIRCRIRLAGIADVDQRVRMARQCRRVGFRRADVHAAVDQRRIDADQAQRKLLAQRAGQRGLAGGGGAHQEDGEGAGVERHRDSLEVAATQEARVDDAGLGAGANERLTSPARQAPAAAMVPDRPCPSASACSACRRGSRACSAGRTSSWR